ncbi:MULTISPECIES: acyltransferase family protein [unclassified Maribacter]|uniref:acyltransferase family protein n=1 Tax=unclassified Maribacter TaxID=2615042 RepID=UPI00258061D6|nr:MULTISPECIES: acyltransferase [unclassified Maribacter]|tara:strand:+ start:131 stop:1726 length:1596 start_codon:yes stop_codon:yes gene_type:complete
MRIASLDYLRGLMALGIMCYHYLVWSYGVYGSETILGKIGIYGVSVFYVLSGLTLYLVYQDKLTLKTIKSFSVKRLARIYPLLWFCILLNILLLAKSYPYEKILLNITGLFGFFAVDQYIPTGAWSIGNELVFYALFPIIVIASRKFKYLVPVFFLITLFIALYFAFFQLSEFDSLGKAWKTYINPLNQLFLFVGGILIGSLFALKENNKLGSILLLLALIIFLLPLSEGDLIHIISGSNRIIYSAGCFILTAAFLLIKFPNFKWVNLILERLGHISYSLYLIHPIVYWFLAKQLNIAENSYSFLSLAVIITLVLSYVVYFYFETRFIEYGRKFREVNFSISSNLYLKPLVTIIVGTILILQANKRNIQLDKKEKQQIMMLKTGSEYSKLLAQRGVYSDSVYKIFIANFDGKKEIVFLKKGTLTDMQQESKFFVHLYPKNQKDLLGKANHNPINFESNFTSFDYEGQLYHVAHTELPDYVIEKLNLGQYSFRGDNSINYKIQKLIIGTEIARVLKENKEEMNIFEYLQETF